MKDPTAKHNNNKQNVFLNYRQFLSETVDTCEVETTVAREASLTAGFPQTV